jgi:hypothetical protein
MAVGPNKHRGSVQAEEGLDRVDQSEFYEALVGVDHEPAGR